MELEFVVPGVPRTIQTKKSRTRNEWKERVREAARKGWPDGRPPLTRELSATVIHFYTRHTELDVDGIGKLILDALIGTAIEDDGLISQVLTRKSNQIGLLVSNPPLILADTLGSIEDFVYVRLSDAPNHQELPP